MKQKQTKKTTNQLVNDQPYACMCMLSQCNLCTNVCLTVGLLAFFPLVGRPLALKRARSLSTVKLWKFLLDV